MTSFRELSIDRERLAEGCRVSMLDRNGNELGWVRVRSEYADEVQTALELAEARLRVNPDLTVPEVKLEARIALVMDWSFDEECSEENVREMLRDQPWNAERIDKAAGNLKNFFPERDLSSSNGLGTKSPSDNPQTESELSANT